MPDRSLSLLRASRSDGYDVLHDVNCGEWGDYAVAGQPCDCEPGRYAYIIELPVGVAAPKGDWPRARLLPKSK